MARLEQQVREWQDRVFDAKALLERDGRLIRWEEYRKWYHNKFPENVVSVNLIFSIGRALVPQLYFKQPMVLVNPTQPEMAQQAKILESVDQWLMKKLGIKVQLKLGILDAYLTNLAVFKFGYHSVGTEIPRGPEQVSVSTDEISSAIGELLGEEAAEQAEADIEELRAHSFHDWINPDTPWMLRVRPEDFLIPVGYKDLASTPWCAFRIVRTLDEFKKDPVYSHTENLQTNTSIEGVTKGESFIEAWEIWDKRDGRVKVIVDDIPHFLRNEETNTPIQGLPVEILQFNPSGWDFWGQSDADQIKAQQIEYNETRTLEIIHKRTAVTKFLFLQDAIDDNELAKFNKGEIAAIKMKLPPQGNVLEISPTMSRDLYNMSEVIRDDVREVLGFSRNQAGDFDVSRRTATEASIVQQAVQIRSDERRDQVADLIASAFQRKIHPMIFAFWDTPRVIEVTALGGWQEYTGTQIAGDYMVEAIPDSVLPLTKAQRQQAAELAFSLFRGDPMIDQRRLYQFVLSQFEGLIPADILVPPQQAQMNELIQAIKAGALGQPSAMQGAAPGNGQGARPASRSGRAVRG